MAVISTQKDTTFTKIFVGGLPYHTTDDTLRKYFEQFGDIEEAVVITDRQTGKSRGYGFVTMADRTAAERACKDPNPVIDGRKANVNLAYLGAKPRGIPAAFPFAIKSGLPGLVQTPLVGLSPQYQIYQAAAAAQTANTANTLVSPAAGLSMMTMSPQSPMSISPAAGTMATATPQYFDYTAYANQLAAAGYTTATAASAATTTDPYGAGMSSLGAYTLPAGYTYATIPQVQTALAGSGQLAAYQAQQLPTSQ